MGSRNFSKALFEIITALSAWAGCGLQLYILLDNTPGNGMTPLQAIGRFFIFFTILTNLLVAAGITIKLFAPSSSAGRFFSKQPVLAAIAVYIVVVGLTYNIILRPLWSPTGLQRVADELLHVATPLLVVFYWLFFSPRQALPWKIVFPWLVYPAIYLVYALIRGGNEGFYPYPFIDLGKLGWSGVLRNAGGMLLLFVIISLLFIFISRQTANRPR